MTSDELALLERAVLALEALRDYFAPAQRKEHKPAVLGTAAYSEADRERGIVRILREKAQNPKG